MTDLVIVVGPVSAGQIGTVAWQRPTKVLSLSSGPARQDLDGETRTIGPAAFEALWNELGSIDAVAAKAGIPAGELGAVGLIAFSAGWAFADPALATGHVDGALLLDACFAPAAGYKTLVKDGYRAFAEAAARGERLLVMTGGPGGRYHPGTACVQANTDAVATTWGSWDPETPVAPTSASSSGALYRASYGSNVTHGGHVTTLGNALATRYLAPWLAEGSRGGGLSGVSDSWLAASAAAIATGAFVFWLLR